VDPIRPLGPPDRTVQPVALRPLTPLEREQEKERREQARKRRERARTAEDEPSGGLDVRA
jgi:hypothetical protein